MRCTVRGKDLEWKGKHQGKYNCKLSVLTNLENFCYQTWILTKPLPSVQLIFAQFAVSFCYISPLTICVCPSLHAAKHFPHSCVWPMSNMFTCLASTTFQCLYQVQSKVRGLSGSHCMQTKVLVSFVSVPLEKKGGEVLQLIQQPKPNLAT